jgi:hypothetical protein
VPRRPFPRPHPRSVPRPPRRRRAADDRPALTWTTTQRPATPLPPPDVVGALESALRSLEAAHPEWPTSVLHAEQEARRWIRETRLPPGPREHARRISSYLSAVRRMDPPRALRALRIAHEAWSHLASSTERRD